ncbi:DNA modification protein [Burkholderia phage BcepSauron]|uniref:DNA modification protein n=1 Tax=Burkholderia phage BcepSauron TaxID=2530033 RepID=A0A482MLT4_9CAUD|nr:DNA modification protein [Burkholderia phage BcepSauron]QBQ74694.1 DNA modification protein [Burkholderia phage BcepSauron]
MTEAQLNQIRSDALDLTIKSATLVVEGYLRNNINETGPKLRDGVTALMLERFFLYCSVVIVKESGRVRASVDGTLRAFHTDELSFQRKFEVEVLNVEKPIYINGEKAERAICAAFVIASAACSTSQEVEATMHREIRAQGIRNYRLELGDQPTLMLRADPERGLDAACTINLLSSSSVAEAPVAVTLVDEKRKSNIIEDDAREAATVVSKYARNLAYTLRRSSPAQVRAGLTAQVEQAFSEKFTDIMTNVRVYDDVSGAEFEVTARHRLMQAVHHIKFHVDFVHELSIEELRSALDTAFRISVGARCGNDHNAHHDKIKQDLTDAAYAYDEHIQCAFSLLSSAAGLQCVVTVVDPEYDRVPDSSVAFALFVPVAGIQEPGMVERDPYELVESGHGGMKVALAKLDDDDVEDDLDEGDSEGCQSEEPQVEYDVPSRGMAVDMAANASRLQSQLSKDSAFAWSWHDQYAQSILPFMNMGNKPDKFLKANSIARQIMINTWGIDSKKLPEWRAGVEAVAERLEHERQERIKDRERIWKLVYQSCKNAFKAGIDEAGIETLLAGVGDSLGDGWSVGVAFYQRSDEEYRTARITVRNEDGERTFTGQCSDYHPENN